MEWLAPFPGEEESRRDALLEDPGERSGSNYHDPSTGGAAIPPLVRSEERQYFIQDLTLALGVLLPM